MLRSLLVASYAHFIAAELRPFQILIMASRSSSKDVVLCEGSRVFEPHPFRQTMFELVFYGHVSHIRSLQKLAENGL